MGGLHPVVAIYATFLNRAFDQLLMDVALHRLPVTVVLDRAGVTGPDGASHHGMWDGSILQVVPGLRIAAPRDAARVAELLNEAVAVSDGPTVVRFPKGTVGGEAELLAAQAEIRDRTIRDELLGYITKLIRGTRDNLKVEVGASPRAGLMVLTAAKARDRSRSSW